MLKKNSQILFFMFLVFNSIYAQLELKVFTDKNNYQYGESILITCSVTNISDSIFSIRAPCYDSFQAEFELNNFNSAIWTNCLTLVQDLVFYPKSSRNYSWTINPERFGLPNKDGSQKIIGHFFYQDLTDTIYINAPLYLGGQLNVGFTTENDSSLLNLKDSLSITVLSRIDYSPTLNKISETWQIHNFQLDSLLSQLLNDNRFNWVEYNRFIIYDSILVTSVEEESVLINDFYLSDAYPNPFNSTTRFYLEIPKTDETIISLFNSLGEKVSTVYDGMLNKNIRYTFEINANNLSSGVYYYSIKNSNLIKSKKIILLK